jgi:hypothetical protein
MAQVCAQEGHFVRSRIVGWGDEVVWGVDMVGRGLGLGFGQGVYDEWIALEGHDDDGKGVDGGPDEVEEWEWRCWRLDL